MRRTREIGVVIAIAALLLLAGGYVGAYLALSEPQSGLTQNRDGSIDMFYGDRFGGGGPYVEAFFWPLTQMDQQLRPQRWPKLPFIDRSGVKRFYGPADPRRL